MEWKGLRWFVWYRSELPQRRVAKAFFMPEHMVETSMKITYIIAMVEHARKDHQVSLCCLA
eukprot:scaffold78515_cov15-Tisochrysis_lutea.AAC.1